MSEQLKDSQTAPASLIWLSATGRWLVIAVGLVRAYLARGSYHGLYYSIEKPLKFFQTGAILEVRHHILHLRMSKKLYACSYIFTQNPGVHVV